MGPRGAGSPAAAPRRRGPRAQRNDGDTGASGHRLAARAFHLRNNHRLGCLLSWRSIINMEFQHVASKDRCAFICGSTRTQFRCVGAGGWRRRRWRRRGVARAALAVEQVEQAAHPEPQATQAAGPVVRAATALLNPPAAKAVRVEILLLNLPAARARIALTRQGRALGRGALVRTVKKL
jgi:hypothetical protein